MFIGRFKLIVQWLIFKATTRIIFFYIISRQCHWKVLYSTFVLCVFFVHGVIILVLNLDTRTACYRIKVIRIWLYRYPMMQRHIFGSFWLIYNTLLRRTCRWYLKLILWKVQRWYHNFWNHHLLFSKCALLKVFWIVIISFDACWLTYILVGFEWAIISRVLTDAIWTDFLASVILDFQMVKISLLFESLYIVIIVLDFQITILAAFWLIKNARVELTDFSSYSSFLLIITRFWVGILWRWWKFGYLRPIIVTLQLPEIRHLFLMGIKKGWLW
jgi:hypothetical protein